MKSCPFCAEDIQDAAIVCKHCGRDLAVRTVATIPTLPREKHTARNVILAIVALIAILITAGYYSPDHQRFLNFDKRRTAWHSNCDRYRELSTGVDVRLTQACKEELDAMTEYAKQQGWDR